MDIVHLTFRGTLNDKLRGFYRSSYQGRPRRRPFPAATQLEATDARRAFPKLMSRNSKPSRRHIGDRSLTDGDLEYPRHRGSAEHGKRVSICQSIRMSTYLVAFIVGQLVPTPPIMARQTRSGSYSCRANNTLTAFGHEIAVYSLNFSPSITTVPILATNSI